MEIFANPENWVALATLTALEIVLGIDNIVFISIIAAKLPAASRARARRTGLALAMIMRILLLLSLSVLVHLTQPIVKFIGYEISARDLVLIVGGLFLLAKSTREIHLRIEDENRGEALVKRSVSYGGVLVQIMLLDIVFSLDSVITAVGMVDEIPVMVAAIVLAVAVMMLFAGSVSDFVERHPTIRILALSFLLLIGVALIADGLDLHIPKGYIYFAMAFSLAVELLNLRLRNRASRDGTATPHPGD
jgi:predicted tellurium resistance membrane protein TerC